MQIFALREFAPPGDVAALREEIRALIAAHEHRWSPEQRANCWFSFDEEFSRALGAAGFLGSLTDRPIPSSINVRVRADASCKTSIRPW